MRKPVETGPGLGTGLAIGFAAAVVSLNVLNAIDLSQWLLAIGAEILLAMSAVAFVAAFHARRRFIVGMLVGFAIPQLCGWGVPFPSRLGISSAMSSRDAAGSSGDDRGARQRPGDPGPKPLAESCV